MVMSLYDNDVDVVGRPHHLPSPNLVPFHFIYEPSRRRDRSRNSARPFIYLQTFVPLLFNFIFLLLLMHYQRDQMLIK